MEEKITIQKENVLKAYKQASGEQKALLENMFGKDMFQPQDIRERVKTFEDARKALGDKHPLVEQYRLTAVAYKGDPMTEDLIAYLKLRIICAALNEGWKQKISEEEFGYYTLHYVYPTDEYNNLSEEEKRRSRIISRSCNNSNSYCEVVEVCGMAVVSSTKASADMYGDSNLAFKTRELAEYCGTQFADIWFDYLLS